ncbi:MAG: hypothetical protein MUF20_00515 [Methylotetracoccus sp.]|jgi:hypothetical protein|nr:hypothetical protein [Methylotetracoccus sp.]
MTGTVAPWYRIRLSREEYDAGESFLVQGVFQASFTARNGPRGAALYGAWDRDGFFFNLYFTPQTRACARALFQAYSAEPCDPPPISRLELIWGDTTRIARGVEF